MVHGLLRFSGPKFTMKHLRDDNCEGPTVQRNGKGKGCWALLWSLAPCQWGSALQRFQACAPACTWSYSLTMHTFLKPSAYIPTKEHHHFYFAIHHIRSCFALVCDWNKISLFLYKLKGVSNGNTSQLKHVFPPGKQSSSSGTDNIFQ